MYIYIHIIITTIGIITIIEDHAGAVVHREDAVRVRGRHGGVPDGRVFLHRSTTTTTTTITTTTTTTITITTTTTTTTTIINININRMLNINI